MSKYTPVAVIVDENKDIVYFHGDSSKFLRSTNGKPSFNLLKMAREGLDFELRNALLKARAGDSHVKITDIAVKDDEGEFSVNVEVVALPSENEVYYLVIFCKNATSETLSNEGRRSKDMQRIQQLEAELLQIREDIRTVNEAQEATIEELQSANEELLSGSEELQTLNEEMETSSEEMQSTNEELISVNDELLDRQEQLSAARNYAESIISSIREPLLILNADMRIRSANKSYYRFFNVSEMETEGMGFFDISYQQWNKVDLRKRMEHILPGGGAIEDYEFTGSFRGLGRRTLLLNARKISNEKYADPLILLSIADITDIKLFADQKVFTKLLKKQVKERTLELERNNQELESYNYVASHDLQEPIRKILMYNSLLFESEKEKLSAESVNMIKSVEASATRMQQLIAALLEYSTSGKKSPASKNVSLNELFADVASDLEGAATQAGVALSAGDLPVINGVPEQLRQLLANLLSNGIKYADQDKPQAFVKLGAVTSELDGVKCVVLKFEDNGIGFEQKYEHKIFELFQRLHGKQEFAGTGIGLALCKKIVIAHQGKIEVTSQPGIGTTFTVTLPV
ncbi:MAG: PAS domain-containing sensor histidine kinase [Proteobacteria bacterium]|nr:MAG: PAS domain-containing sensor histidine kinase [Pseudomonadota bacterium]